MKRYMFIFLSLSVVLIISVIIAIFVLQRRPQEREFSGYILWLREAVVFTNKVNLDADSLFKMIGPVIWVEQDDIVYSVYDQAYMLTTGTSPYDDDDIKIIKVVFKGLYYDEDRLYWRNGPYEARTRVRVTDIISYSSAIEN